MANMMNAEIELARTSRSIWIAATMLASALSAIVVLGDPGISVAQEIISASPDVTSGAGRAERPDRSLCSNVHAVW